MKFRKMSEEKPDVGEEILAYITHYYDPSDNVAVPLSRPYFYVVTRGYDNKYTEANGEQYADWKECEIEGWCYTSEIEVKY